LLIAPIKKKKTSNLNLYKFPTFISNDKGNSSVLKKGNLIVLGRRQYRED